jgi:hypothetical protein
LRKIGVKSVVVFFWQNAQNTKNPRMGAKLQSMRKRGFFYQKVWTTAYGVFA